MVVTRQLDDKVALVTGASAGIGRATALALAEEGTDVSLAARRKERLEELADTIESETESRAVVHQTDVREETQVNDLVEATVEDFGGLDIAVANAGVGAGEGIEDMATEEYRFMMDVNTDGVFFTTRAALPHLRAADGNLIFVGSFAGQYPRPFNPVYAATKWWTRGFAQSVEARVGSDDVAVSIVNPTEVRTEWGGEDADPMKERHEPGTVTEPPEIAEAIVFAAKQTTPNTVSELNLYRRDKFSHF